MEFSYPVDGFPATLSPLLRQTLWGLRLAACSFYLLKTQYSCLTSPERMPKDLGPIPRYFSLCGFRYFFFPIQTDAASGLIKGGLNRVKTSFFRDCNFREPRDALSP